MPEIQDITYRHEAILRWMVCNPDKPLKQCAQDLGYTQAWLSVIVHSDIFQARLRHMQDSFNEDTLVSLREKLQGIAHTALDKMADNLQFVDDPKSLLDIADKTLSRLGYGAKGVTVNQTNNTLNQTVNMGAVSPSVLEEARRLRQGFQQTLQETIDAEELLEFPLDQEVSAAQVLLEGVPPDPVTETSVAQPSLAQLLYGGDNA